MRAYMAYSIPKQRKYYSGRDEGKSVQGKQAANLLHRNNLPKTKRNSESTTKCIAFYHY